MTSLTTRDLNRALLARQLLLEREDVSPVTAVEQLAGLQAQDPGPPFVGLWTRIEDFHINELLDAIEARAVVRGTLQRGTLHLVSSRDYLAFRASLQPALDQALRVLGARAEGLDVAALLPVARELLADGPLTFGALRPLLAERFPQVDERALGYAVRTNLPLVMEATDDRWGYARSSRFTLAEDWLAEVSGDDDRAALQHSPSPEAADQLVRRYLAAFGPASPQDFQSWSGVPDSEASFERLRDELAVFTDERGGELLDLPDAPRPLADTEAPARFLPEFDNIVLGHADRSRIIADKHRPGLVTKNLRVRATFLWDGFAAGTWTVERSKKSATLKIEPFQTLPAGAIRALKREGERLLEFTDEHATSRSVRVG